MVHAAGGQRTEADRSRTGGVSSQILQEMHLSNQINHASSFTWQQRDLSEGKRRNCASTTLPELLTRPRPDVRMNNSVGSLHTPTITNATVHRRHGHRFRFSPTPNSKPPPLPTPAGAREGPAAPRNRAREGGLGARGVEAATSFPWKREEEMGCPGGAGHNGGLLD